MLGITGFVTGGATGLAKEWGAGALAIWWVGSGTLTFLLGKAVLHVQELLSPNALVAR